MCESLDFAEEGGRTEINKVLVLLDRHFVGEVNETFERFTLNQRNQELNESIDTYVSALRAMVNPFAALEESFLRDRIVIGIRDDGARRKLIDSKPGFEICARHLPCERSLVEAGPRNETS